MIKVIKIIKYKIDIIIIELCCCLCHFRKMHEGHKLCEINDQESLKKENITLNASSNDFNNILSKLNNLKDKIKKEILRNEEKSMKEKLQNEVTKIKEKMEINLSESERLIRENERILKGINSLKKQENENMIKILTYISKINKNKKNLSQFFCEKMKNMKILFNEEQNNIIYEEYYFNFPINIKIDNVSYDYFDVSWEIDEIKEKFNKDDLKYFVEIREEKEEDKFKKIYEGNEMKNFKITKLNVNTNYEIRICTILKGIENTWSEIKKIKTLDWKNYCDSKILQESNKNDEFCKILKDWTKSNKLELLYRGSRDGSTSNDFHSRCDNKGATICLYKNDKNYIFGGYNPVSWNENDGWIKNDDSFIFTLTNVHNTEPTKFPHKNGNDSIHNNKNFGPTFDDFYIQNSNAYIHFPRGHIDSLNLGKSIFSGDKDNSISTIKILEIEVYQVLK